tara:strand:+ start:3970 stop:4494 length:525 start_codon:yes stop_codon:yes gene_type:complete
MILNEKLATIQTKFKSKKSRFNSFGKYNFRSAEDILEATKPYLLELGVSVVISENLIATTPFPILESKATMTDGKDAIHATAVVGIDLDQKGMQMPQKFGSASSYGKKYALGNLFLIDDTQDSDAVNGHGKTKTAKPKLEGQALAKAKEFLAKGGSIDAIKGKYDIPAAILKTL